jgi:lysophospholipase L1-like esterase
MFFYVLSRSNLYPAGHINKYYIISFAGILFFTYVLLRFNLELKVKIALLILSFSISLYAIEIFLSYSKPNKIEHVRAELAKKSGIPYDSRHRTQLWLDLRNKGIDAYPLYNPYDNMDFKDSEILPLGFISGKTTISCNESGEFVIYKTDEHGFNNPEGLYDENNIDYVLIGDSFTQGACVKREDNIAGRLKTKYKKVLNLGMLNSGPPKELAILKEYAKPLKPKIVFWMFFEGNDHEGLEFEIKSPLIMKYLNKEFSQHLFNKQNKIDEILIEQLEKEFANVNKNIILTTEKNNKDREGTFNVSLSSITLPQLRNRLGGGDKGCENIFNPFFKDFLTEAKRAVNDWGGQLVFVYLPSYERYSEKVNMCRKRFLDTERKEVFAVINELQLPIIDIQSVFDSHADPLSFFPFRLSGHFNAKGYKLVAELMDKYLSNHREKAEEHF